MSVVAREKAKGSGIWWLFINHNGRRKSKKIGRDKAEAMRLAKILEGRLAAGDLCIDDLNKADPVEPFSYYCDQWLIVIMPTECKESTQADYKSIYKVHLRSAPFFDKSVDKVTEADIETYLIRKRQVKARSTCVHIKNAISNSFKRALKARVITVNPCAGVTIPKNNGKPGQLLNAPYNEQEIERLLEAFKGHRYYTFVLFLCRTGCRSGEVAGLQWADIDLDKRKARIHRGIVRGKLTKSTKSDKDRKVDLTPMVVTELRKLKLQNQGKGLWVFQGSTGNYVDVDNFRGRVWYPMLEKHGFTRIRIHDLRHSYASFLISKSKDIYYAQKQLGHHSIQVTVDRYGHLLEEESETRLVDVLDEVVAL